MRDFTVTIVVKVKHGPTNVNASNADHALAVALESCTAAYGSLGYEVASFGVEWTDANGKARFMGRMA